mmetsp:Transcript_40224/g.92472  ORF Transcript_40224/g.92472 Transcript_40224/m.92472 type:complete len:452 (+) Transcript_40224:69-1424(+)
MGCAHTQAASWKDSRTAAQNFDKQESEAECMRQSESGRFFAKYSVGQKLGEGAFGEVWVAIPSDRQHAGKERLAVKKVDIKRAGKQNASEVACWRAVTESGCSHCIRLHEVFNSDMACRLIMEQCDMTLLVALKQAPDLHEGLLSRIFCQMATAIAGLHRLRIIHRDIKPDNFMVNEGMHVKLGDFGFSTFCIRGLSFSEILGTPSYMSPEMLLANILNKPYDEKTDMWSFGVLMYVLIYGQFPYYSPEQKSPAIKKTIIEGKVEPSFRPWKHVLGGAGPSNVLSGLIKELLERNPARRASAEQVLAHPYWQYSSTAGLFDDAPCLRPVLCYAIKHGAFACKDFDGLEDVETSCALSGEEASRDRVRPRKGSLGSEALEGDKGSQNRGTGSRIYNSTKWSSTSECSAAPELSRDLAVSKVLSSDESHRTATSASSFRNDADVKVRRIEVQL